MTSSPPRRPTSSIASSPACRCTWVHLPHQRRRRPSSPHPSTSPRRILTGLLTAPLSSPLRRHVVVVPTPCRRRRVTFARVGMAPACMGWHLGSTSEHVRALLRACSPLAHLFQTGMSCRAVCMFVPRRAAHAARRRVVHLVAHLVVVHLGKHLVVHLLCIRHPRTRELGSCTGNAPVLHLLPASHCRRRVVVASSSLAKTMGSSPRRPIVASSSSSPHGIPAVSPHRIPHLVRRGFTRYPHLSPILTRLGSGVRTRIRKPLQRGPAASTQ